MKNQKGITLITLLIVIIIIIAGILFVILISDSPDSVGKSTTNYDYLLDNEPTFFCLYIAP